MIEQTNILVAGREGSGEQKGKYAVRGKSLRREGKENTSLVNSSRRNHSLTVEESKEAQTKEGANL